MDDSFWNQICRSYGLGVLAGQAQSVTGGLQHRLYRISTATGKYAVKILNPRLVSEPGRRSRYEHAERLAQSAARAGLPALAAIAGPNGPLLSVAGTTCMVFPWHIGTVLPPTASSQDAARQIGRLMGSLHSLRLRQSEETAHISRGFSDAHWTGLIDEAQAERVVWASPLAEALPALLEWSHAAQTALKHLDTDAVLTHRDMDQKNVLWADAQTPWLLDWEDAGLMNPMLELMGTALNWAGQSAGAPSRLTFTAFLQGYSETSWIDREALGHAAVAVLEKWLIWLEFNMRRSLNAFGAAAEERAMAFGAVAHSLATLKSLVAETPVRLEWCGGGRS